MDVKHSLGYGVRKGRIKKHIFNLRKQVHS